jgi:hypothetical protein
MKISLINNAEIVIQANPNKSGDFAAAIAIAEKMVDLDTVKCDIAAIEDDTQIVHVCAVWDFYQMSELKDAYEEAKFRVMGVK